jgi:hypothetical protein
MIRIARDLPRVNERILIHKTLGWGDSFWSQVNRVGAHPDQPGLTPKHMLASLAQLPALVTR